MNRLCPSVAVALCVFHIPVHADDRLDGRTSLVQLKSLGKLADNFTRSRGNHFPKTLEELIAFEKAPESLLISPMAAAANKSGPGYELLLPGEELSKVRNPARTVFIRSRYKLQDGRLPVLYVDGHVELLDAGK
jgi:prepilin-type processing-associated H-X9-DG protein